MFGLFFWHLLIRSTAKWIEDFNNIKREIDNALSGIDYTIEHVGSTSVPNLDSKSIIDIDIIFSSPEDWIKIKSGLKEIGYFHNGNQGIDDRDVFKRKENWENKILDRIKHHLYVCPTDSKALERHILSRNSLRKNNWARLKYQEIKYQLAEKANQDKKKYARLKEPYVNDFIDSIIAKENN